MGLDSRRSLALAVVAMVMAVWLGACSPTTEQATSTSGLSTAPSLDAPSPTSPVPEPTMTTGPLALAVAPADPLLVVGDWGSGTVPQGTVSGAMASRAEVAGPIAAIVTTGDNFYSDDAEFLMEPFGWAVDAGIPFWVSWGNHDVETPTRIDAVNETFDSPPRWATITWGRFDLMILDSNQIDEPAQLAFIDSEMAAIDRPMIVVFHHPAYSCSRHGSNRDVIANWLPRFDGDVVLVLAGHEHNYQRFAADGIEWVVTGGGGRGIYGIDDCPTGHPRLQASAEKHHFLVLADSGSSLDVTAYDVIGDPLDEFSIDVP